MSFADRDVTFGDTHFQIGKLLPMEAKRVFMGHVRPMLAGALDVDIGSIGRNGTSEADAAADDESVSMETVLAGIKVVAGIITKAPQGHYDAVMAALYQQITFTSPTAPMPMKLAGNEEQAFMDLDMGHILALDARAFYINFSGSWDVLRSEFPFLSRIFSPSTGPTLTPSSGTQSPPDSAL